MLALAHRPGLSAAEITGLWAMEKMAVNRAIRRLDRFGRVSRRVDPDDRRRFTLRLTAKGRRFHDKVLPAANARYREILSGLSRSEAEALRTTLARLTKHIATLPE